MLRFAASNGARIARPQHDVGCIHTRQSNERDFMPQISLSAASELAQRAALLFLETLRICAEDETIADEITNRYLQNFLDNNPDRAEEVVGAAREAMNILPGFADAKSGFTAKANWILTYAGMADSALSIRVIRAGMDAMTWGPSDNPDPTLRLLESIKGWKEKTEDYKRIAAATTDTATAHCLSVAEWLELASLILLTRHEILFEFRAKTISRTWADVGRESMTQLGEEADSEAVQKLWDALLDIAGETMGFVIEEASILHKFPQYLERIGKVFGVREVITAPGASDAVLILLRRLKSDAADLAKADADSTRTLDALKTLVESG